MPHLNDDTCNIPVASLCVKRIEYKNIQADHSNLAYLYFLDECLVAANCLDAD